MKVGEHQAVRAHGTVTLDLADGRTATLEVDIPLGLYAEFLIDHDYGEPEFQAWGRPRPSRPHATTYALRVPTDLRAPEPTLTLRWPTGPAMPLVYEGDQA